MAWPKIVFENYVFLLREKKQFSINPFKTAYKFSSKKFIIVKYLEYIKWNYCK